MKVLLDTNVWRYVVDHKATGHLLPASRKGRTTLVIVPTVAHECLHLQDTALRNRLIELITRSCWYRAMPDAYYECEDLKKEIARARPHWMRPNANLDEYRQFRYDWTRKSGGFWSHTRMSADIATTEVVERHKPHLTTARSLARETRDLFIEQQATFNDKSLATLTGTARLRPTGEIVGPVDFWRIWALGAYHTVLQDDNYAFSQWLRSEVNIKYMLSDSGDYSRFWLYDAQTTSLPRCWMRAAFEVLQGERKVTNGNPGDSQLAVHLVDADIVVSADRNFVSIVDRCRKEAPFPVAQPYRIPAGKEGVDVLLSQLEHRFKS